MAALQCSSSGFHSYCFDLLGKIGSLKHSENIVRDAAAMIRNGEVEESRITKTVVVIDEAQDMDAHEYALVEALMERNEDMRVIAVGDDDQNIYEFRGSDSGHLKSLIDVHGAKQYDLLDNYRSCRSIVALVNRFVRNIKQMVLRHKSGDRLYLRGKLVFEQPDGTQTPIAVLCRSARERLDQLQQRGYRITDTRIRFIVARAREEQGTESAVVLLDVELRGE